MLIGCLVLRLVNLDHVRLWLAWAVNTMWILGEHDQDPDTDDGLLHWDVADSLSDELLGRVTTLDHVTLPELHGLSPSAPHLTGDDNFATPSACVHDEPNDGVGSAPGWDPVNKLEAEVLKLVLGGKTPLLDAVDKDLELLVLDAPPLHNHVAKLLEPAAVVLDELVDRGGLDDDLGTGWGGANLATAIALLSKLTSQELAKFGVEEAGLDDFADLSAALSLHRKRLGHNRRPPVNYLAVMTGPHGHV